MKPIAVDLYSDTKTRPSAAMRQAMAAAEVGDEQMFEDPTVNRLTERCAELLGKEDAMFLPSGIMANQIGLRVLSRHGDDVICERDAHIVHYEAGATSALSGLNIQSIAGDRGRFTAEQVRPMLRRRTLSGAGTAVISVEQTTNLGGGAIWDLPRLRELAVLASEHQVALHMDGARLMHAVVATGHSAADFAQGFDAVWVDFSKGLGAPVGAALAGSRDFIREAWYFKKQFGGAMRQAGILAAAALYALDHHVADLAEDHRRARELAVATSALPGLCVDLEAVETNLVYLRRPRADADAYAAALEALGVRVSVMAPDLLRAVTHRDIDDQGIQQAISAFEQLAEREARA